MNSFQCDNCGMPYQDEHTFTVCPYCCGEKKYENCTCKKSTNWIGVVTGILKINPNCRIHNKPNKPTKIKSE